MRFVEGGPGASPLPSPHTPLPTRVREPESGAAPHFSGSMESKQQTSLPERD